MDRYLGPLATTLAGVALMLGALQAATRQLGKHLRRTVTHAVVLGLVAAMIGTTVGVVRLLSA